MPIISEKVDTPLLQYLKAVADRLAAEDDAERLAGLLQKGAEAAKDWRPQMARARAGLGSQPSPEEWPNAQQLRQALEKCQRAQEQEATAWKDVPKEWKAVLDRMRQQAPPS
jgi:hypothetical protein